MNVVRLFSYIYCHSNETELLLFNTLFKKIYRFALPMKFYEILKGNILVKENNSRVDLFLQIVRKEGLGIVLSHFKIENKIFKFDYYNLLKTISLDWIEKNRNNQIIIKENIFEISVYLDSSYDIYTLHENKFIDSKIDYNLLRNYFSENIFYGLKKIQFISSHIDYIKLKEVLDVTKNIECIELLVSKDCDILLLRKIKSEYQNLSISFFADVKQLINKKTFDLFEDYTCIYFLRKYLDFKILRKLNCSCLNSIKCQIAFDADPNFLTKILSYNVNELPNEGLDLHRILINEVINELYFGRIAICYNGDIFGGPFLKIGSYKSEISYSKLLDDKISPWLYTRNLFITCKNCNFSGLCPPVTLYEIINRRVYCEK